MSSPDCKRLKLADDIDSVAKMSKVSPTKNVETQTENITSRASTSKKLCAIIRCAWWFKEVARLDGFVDRTMLIEELLEGQKGDEATNVMIFAPSRVGRTVNLDMIRLFCDIADKKTKTKEDVAKDPTMEDLRSNPSKNMKVFLRQFKNIEYEECLILKREQFVIQHFGRHPVIRFNFMCSKAENKSEAILLCAKQLRHEYFENEYLKNSKELQSIQHGILKTRCTNWVSYDNDKLKELSLDDVIDGLKNLIKSLRIHWGRKPVFLVDEVDRPCIDAIQSNKLSEEQVREIGTSITTVICSILKSGDEQLKLQAALVTGTCNFKNSGQAPTDNTVPVYFSSDERFSKYYGLTTQDVNTLVERFCGSQGDAEKTNKIKDIAAKYNGYYQCSISGENKKDARYCLYSVLNCLTDPWRLCFCSHGSFWTVELVKVVRKSVEILSALQILFYDDSGTIEIQYQKAVNVEHILGLFREEMEPDPDAVFNFFLQRGYLAHNPEKSIKNVAGDVMIHVRIPNRHMKLLYRDLFNSYFHRVDNNIRSKLTRCGEIFPSLPTQNSIEFQNKLDELCEHLKCIFKFMQCTSERTICCHILAILKRYAGNDKEYMLEGEREYTVKYFDDNGKQTVVYTDVWGRHGNFAIIFEVKFNSTATCEPGKSGCKTKSSLAAAEDLVKLLPGKKEREDRSVGKAGTSRDLEVLKSQIDNYILIGMAVDGDCTTHMLVFRNTSDWKNVIQVNPENHVAELISTHLTAKIPVET